MGFRSGRSTCFFMLIRNAGNYQSLVNGDACAKQQLIFSNHFVAEASCSIREFPSVKFAHSRLPQ